MASLPVPGLNILLLEYRTGDKSDNVSNTGIGTKHFTLGVPVPVIKAIMCRIPVYWARLGLRLELGLRLGLGARAKARAKAKARARG